MHIYRRIATDSGDELGRAIPGANFRCVADSGRSFGGRYWHLQLDWMVLSRMEVDQASVVTTDERVPDFSVWHVMSGRCAANGRDVAGNELVEVRPGEGGTMRSADVAQVMTFGLQSSLFSQAPELELPFGPSSARPSGRWRMASDAPRPRFEAVTQAMWRQLEEQPRLLDSPANRTTLRNALLEAIAPLGEAGAFRPDRSTVGRHNRIVMRLKRAIEEAGDQPIDMADLCRQVGASRRSLEAIVRQRTGKSPWEYLRWRRLWRARAMLRRPSSGAIAVCATDIEIIKHGLPAIIDGGSPFNKNFTPGHEYMGEIGNRVAVEVHAGCGRCLRCREGMYTSCLNYGFSTDGGFAEYAINSVNTMVHVPDDMSDEEATLIVTSGTAMYGLDVMGGIVAGEPVVVLGPGPIGLMGVGVAKALGASPVILTGTRERRLEMGKRLGADHVIDVTKEGAVEAVQRITHGKGVHYVLECSGAPNALNEAARMVNRGGRICLAAFPAEPVPVDLAHLVRNNIYVFGIRGEGKSATHRAAALMAQKRFDAKLIHTHTFGLSDVPTAIKYARERIEDAIKVVVKMPST